jgi:hypothetical protein
MSQVRLVGLDRRLSFAHHITTAADLPSAFALWERGFRPNVELNQGLATDGMSTLPPASRFGRIERASRAVALPDQHRLVNLPGRTPCVPGSA